jgi:hypothetical protein
MKKEINSDYLYKNELIKSYVFELIFFALKLSPYLVKPHVIDANMRITSVFMKLLDRQFPIETLSHKFTCRTPADFAGQLAIH